MVLRPEWAIAKPHVEASLHHLDLERSDRLEPPWPDLVVTIGRRPSMAALWIKERSGGRTRLVIVGKPSGPVESFDLVVAGPEAQLPPLPSVFKLTLPLMRVPVSEIEAAAKAWHPLLSALPRPLIAFGVGGPTSPFVFDSSVLHRLVAEARGVVAQGGTPYFTTSRRTPSAFVDTLRRELPHGTPLFHWAPDAGENPYRALLALADGFVVTGDSISMQVEVIRAHKPLAILPLPPGGPIARLDHARRSFSRWLFDETGTGLRRFVARALFRMGIASQTRDFPAFHRMLVSRGLAVFAGGPLRAPTGAVPDDLERAAMRVRQLVTAA
jgi:mitochondrial fission protein ELM1